MHDLIRPKLTFHLPLFVVALTMDTEAVPDSLLHCVVPLPMDTEAVPDSLLQKLTL